MYFLGAVGVLFVIWAPAIVHLFTADAEVARIGATGLRIVAAGFPFYAWGMVLTQSFNGAGDTWTPTWINLVCFWLFEVPLGWFLAITTGMGPRGVFLAITLAYALLAVVSGVLFRRGTWKYRSV
jgi:Na+-driven multidrug efflux pump